jgi:AraC family transcriptional regulator, regulatory protein of adaptative response / DNA-3-methyladenine glycosylase II
MVTLDPEVCFRALASRDVRFDGRFFVAVRTTKIYCRPICPAGPALRKNCEFFASAAAAQTAGYRPCLRCRPESAPNSAAWAGPSTTVNRGLTLIAAGALDPDDCNVEELAARLGVGGRHLRRLFEKHLGATPIAVAQTRRVLLAKQLVHETDLSMSDVALASGYRSVRRFNEAFVALFDRPPASIRRRKVVAVHAPIRVNLRYQPPYDWLAMLGYLRARAIDGLETVDQHSYSRIVRVDSDTAKIHLVNDAARSCVVATLKVAKIEHVRIVIGMIRNALDLDVDISAINSHFANDIALRNVVAAQPGTRVAGAWNGFETAMRAVLGQQVSLNAGRRLTEQLVALAGPATGTRGSGEFLGSQQEGTARSPINARSGTLTTAFPTANEVLKADLSKLKMPKARRTALTALASAAMQNSDLFAREETLEKTVAKLTAIRGVGPWTAQYIALRVAREPDAFPSSDAALLRHATAVTASGVRKTQAQLEQMADAWRPWRAYAAQHLWNFLGTP